LCFDIYLTYTFVGFLMLMEEAKGAEGINDEEQQGAGNDGGPSAAHDGGNDVLDMVEGHQDTTEGDRGHK
jgi:hypothetical protein